MPPTVAEPAGHDSPTPPPRPAPRTGEVTFADIGAALRAGAADFRARPVMSGFFGLFYAAFGIFFVWTLLWLGKVWMVIPLAVAFPLVAPFAAAGLYEMSRRMEKGEDFGWSDILTVIARQRQRDMGWMAFVTLIVFWVWMYQIRLWLALILQDSALSDLQGFLHTVFFTTQGWTFLAVGTAVGAALATALFSLTVIAMPMLLDRDVDFITAMITSVRVVLENPVVMLGWGAFIAVALMLSMLPAFLGLIITLPILGHATWHLYRRVVLPEEA